MLSWKENHSILAKYFRGCPKVVHPRFLRSDVMKPVWARHAMLLARRLKRSRYIISGKVLSPVYGVCLNRTWNDKDSCSSSSSIKRTTVNTESWKLINLIITLKMLLINNYYNDPCWELLPRIESLHFCAIKQKLLQLSVNGLQHCCLI